MTIERADPDRRTDERTSLRQWLEYHRQTLALKCDGLNPEQLRRRAVSPSTVSLLGLVRHMAEVERNWFRRVMERADAPPRYYSEQHPDGEFEVDAADIDEAFAYWRDECEHARDVERSFASLDDLGHHRRQNEDFSLRWILVHMIEEYARHNGHADLLRERIDGATGD